jgi:hypothetical protein
MLRCSIAESMPASRDLPSAFPGDGLAQYVADADPQEFALTWKSKRAPA